MTDTPVIATAKTRHALATARSGASPPRSVKCLKTDTDAEDSETITLRPDAEPDAYAETFPEDDEDFEKLKDECFNPAAPSTPTNMVPTMFAESTLLLASIQASLKEQHSSLSANICGVKTELFAEVSKVSDKVEKVQRLRIESTRFRRLKGRE